jgi:hypothetical protein
MLHLPGIRFAWMRRSCLLRLRGTTRSAAMENFADDLRQVRSLAESDDPRALLAGG